MSQQRSFRTIGKRAPRDPQKSRRAATLVLAALLIVAMLGMVAFAMDVGYIVLVRSQLQTAADAAAMAAAAVLGADQKEAIEVAQQYAGFHVAGGRSVELRNEDVELGIWHDDRRAFEPGRAGNAIRITTRRDSASGGEAPLFFSRVFGKNTFEMSASAVAVAKMRDIAFVVDLSGSMNDDTEPAWATAAIDDSFGPAGFPGLGTALMAQVYQDLNFKNTSNSQSIGQPLGVPVGALAYVQLTADNGPMSGTLVQGKYRINKSDNEWERKKKAYQWMVDNQVIPLMPAARPQADYSSNYDYWERYLDYVITPLGQRVAQLRGQMRDAGDWTEFEYAAADFDAAFGRDLFGARPLGEEPTGQRFDDREFGRWFARHNKASNVSLLTGGMGRHEQLVATGPNDAWLLGLLPALVTTAPGGTRSPAILDVVPPQRDVFRIVDFNNPNVQKLVGALGPAARGHTNRIGYATFTQFMMDFGREMQPDGTQYTQHSVNSPFVRQHWESTAGGVWWFPAREQPMHNTRRALIAALKTISDRNAGIADADSRDWVSIITVDGLVPNARLRYPLSSDYVVAMSQCTQLQSTGDQEGSMSLEEGIQLAEQHIESPSNGGAGRDNTLKEIILITDGTPESFSSDPNKIKQYMAEHPSTDYYGGLNREAENSVLVRAAQLRSRDWRFSPVGVGLNANYDLLDRAARLGGTADVNGRSPRTVGNPVDYETMLRTHLREDAAQVPSNLVQ